MSNREDLDFNLVLMMKALFEMLREHKEVMLNNNQLLREYIDALKKVKVE
jgi:hypothetical protein